MTDHDHSQDHESAETRRRARDEIYAAYVRELAREGRPRVVTFDQLGQALRGYRVVVLGGFSVLGYEHPEILRREIAALVKARGDRSAYVLGGTAAGIGRAYGWIPEVASDLGFEEVKTAGIVSRNAAEWGVAPQDLVVFVDTAVDDWEVKVDGRSLLVSLAEETGGEMIYFRGGEVSREEIAEALERGVPVTVYTGEGLAPNAAKLARKVDGTVAHVEAQPRGLKIVQVEP